MSLKDKLGLMIGMVIGLIIVIAVFNIVIYIYDVVVWGCGIDEYAKYYQDSPCFDVNFRCEVECSHFNRTSIPEGRDGCKCDCGDIWVSLCSGFPYDKDST